MANGKYEIREVRFVVEPELTQCYILMAELHDCPIGVSGWHHKTFPVSKSTLDIMNDWANGVEQPVMWPLNAPPTR